MNKITVKGFTKKANKKKNDKEFFDNNDKIRSIKKKTKENSSKGLTKKKTQNESEDDLEMEENIKVFDNKKIISKNSNLKDDKNSNNKENINENKEEILKCMIIHPVFSDR
jgi:hypothetical protein